MRNATIPFSFVQRRQFARQDGHRPSVADDVVRVEDQNMIFLVEFEEKRGQQGPGSEIEGSVNFFHCQSSGPLLALLRWNASQVREYKWYENCRSDDLYRLIVDRLESSA